MNDREYDHRTTYPPNTNAVKDKNFKSVESKGVPIAITKINPLPSSVEDTPATSDFRSATIRSISPPKQPSGSSIFDLNFPPLSSSKDSNQKLHPIHKIDSKQPICLNQDLSPPPRSSYKFFKHRQNRPSSGCKVDSAPSSSFSPLLSSSNSIMVLPNKRPIESEDIDGGKSAKMKIFSSSLSLPEEKYNQTNGKPVAQADFSSTNGTISTFDNNQTQQGDKAGENHYDDNIIVIDTVEDDKSDSNGIDQSKPPIVYAIKSKADERYVSNPVFPTESTQDSCMSNESSNSATTSKSSNSGYRFYTTSNRNWRRKQDMSRSSVTVCDNQNGRLADTSTSVDGMMAKMAIDDQKKSSDKSAKNGKSKSNTTSKSKNASAKACDNCAKNYGSKQSLNASERKKKIVAPKKHCSVVPAERKSNRLSRAPSRTDARPQRNVHSVYSKITLHEKKEKLEAQQKNKKAKQPPVKSQSGAVARSSRNEPSLLASNKIKKVPLPAQNQSNKPSNEPPIQSSLSKGPSTSATTTENNAMTFPNSPQTVEVVKQSQAQNSSSYGSDPGQSGSNSSVSISQMISTTLNSNNGGQSPKQISGPFIRIIQKGKPAESSGISTVPNDSPIRSPRSEIKRIEEQEKIKFFVINKPEEVKPLPAVSNGNVGLAQCSNRTMKECIRQCEEQQQQSPQAQSITMSQRYRLARQQMESDVSEWMCIFCKRRSYENRLGPLFGPYFDPSGFLTEIWFHEDCYMWTMLPMVTPARPLPPEAIHVIQMCSLTTCLLCGLPGANIQCMDKSCQAICLHYICAHQQDYFFDEISFKIYCSKHYESIVLGKTEQDDSMEDSD